MASTCLKRKHSFIRVRRLMALIQALKADNQQPLCLARVAPGIKTEDLSLEQLEEYFDGITGESLAAVLEVADREINIQNARLALHICILEANGRGQPMGQELLSAQECETPPKRARLSPKRDALGRRIENMEHPEDKDVEQERKKKMVNKNRVRLVENGNLSNFRDHMLQHEVFSAGEVERMESEGYETKIMSACVDELFRKPLRVVLKFFQVLKSADECLYKQLDLTVPTDAELQEFSEMKQSERPPTLNGNAKQLLNTATALRGSQRLSGLDKVYDNHNNERSNVKVSVIRKSSELLCYLNGRSKKVMEYFNIVGMANETGEFVHLRVYQIHQFRFVRREHTYKFGNIVKKSKNTYWIVKDSVFGLTGSSSSNFHEAKPECPLLPEDELSSGALRTLEEAVLSEERSTVVAKVVQVSPVKYIPSKGSTLAVRNISVKDSSPSTVKISLFANDAEANYERNDVVRLTSLYKRVYRNRVQLHTSKTSSVQFLSHDRLPIEVGESDCLSDDDFENIHPMVTVRITECVRAKIYRCCNRRGCWEKKLNDYGWCEKCGELADEETKACLAAFNYVTDSSESPTKVTLFKSTLSTLLRDDVDLTSEEAFVTQIANALPICFKCEIREGKFHNISLQRSAINDR